MRKRDPSRRELEKIVRKDAEHQLRAVDKFVWLLGSFDRGYKTGGATIAEDESGELILVVDRGLGKKKHKFRITVQAKRIA